MSQNNDYVHGYSEKEMSRLNDQAKTLTELLHHDTVFPAGSRILEAGCGVGAQTVIIAGQNKDSQITSIDISKDSVKQAKANTARAGISNVNFQVANIFDLPFEDASFDHIFVCFVLEHLPEPASALKKLKRLLTKDGTITVIEGDHGSAYYHPKSEYAQKAINCLVEMQAKMGGDSLIGRQLYPLLIDAGFKNVNVSPRMVYADAGKPEMVDGFTKKTFNAMVAGIAQHVMDNNMLDRQTWEKGLTDLHRCEQDDGVFCYTFFKATASK